MPLGVSCVPQPVRFRDEYESFYSFPGGFPDRRITPLRCNLLSLGLMDEITQFWNEIVARPTGPMAMRFALQPIMATLFAVRDGLKDARQQNPAYFWALFTDPAHRTDLMREGWRSIRKVFILAVTLDLIYEVFFLRAFRPVQSLLIAATLAIVPYLIIRGPVNRIVRNLRRGGPTRRAA